MVQPHPLIPIPSVSHPNRERSLASILYSGDWVTLLLNSHPWLPSAQGTKPDLHGQPPFMIWPLPISLVSSPPHSPHTWLQTCLAPPGLWACAQVDPGLECPSSPLPVKILLKCHLPCEALPNLPSQIITQASAPPKDAPANSKEPQAGISEPVFPQHRELRRERGSSQPSVQGEDRAYRAWRPYGTRVGAKGPRGARRVG